MKNRKTWKIWWLVLLLYYWLSKFTFFINRFPKDTNLRQRWLLQIGRPDFTPTVWSTVCSDHFPDDCFVLTTINKRLKEDTFPSIFGYLQCTKNSEQALITREVQCPSENENPDECQAQKKQKTSPSQDHSDHSYALPGKKEMKQRIDELMEANDRLRKKVKAVKRAKTISGKNNVILFNKCINGRWNNRTCLWVHQWFFYCQKKSVAV